MERLILDGSKEEREKIMKEFFGLTPDQSYQDIQIDDNNSKDNKVVIQVSPGAG